MKRKGRNKIKKEIWTNQPRNWQMVVFLLTLGTPYPYVISMSWNLWKKRSSTLTWKKNYACLCGWEKDNLVYFFVHKNPFDKITVEFACKGFKSRKSYVLSHIGHIVEDFWSWLKSISKQKHILCRQSSHISLLPQASTGWSSDIKYQHLSDIYTR